MRDLASPRRRDLVAGAGLAAMFVGLGVCWLLAAPQGPSAFTLPSVVAVGAGVLVVGLGSLPMVSASPPVRLTGLVGVIWLVSALISAVARAADQSGVSVARLGLGQFGRSIGTGAPEVVAAACGAGVVAWAAVALLGGGRSRAVSTPSPSVVAVLGAIGVVALSVSGHASRSTLGPVVIGAHALGAAWWCGALLAMVLALRGRWGWSTSLPEFSRRAPWAVGVVAASGLLAGVLELGIGPEWFDTGYGRVLLAKTVALTVLLGVAAWHRRRWVPAAARHRVTETTAIARAGVEIVVMGVALGLAVGLSATAV